MCKWIKDILFPTNVLGKNVKTFSFPQVHPPYTSYNYDVIWTGERLEFTCTRFLYAHGRTTQESIRHIFTDGNESQESFTIIQGQRPGSAAFASDLYLKCTNVTYLSINGEQYI